MRRVPTHLPGMLTRDEMVAAYAERTGRSVTPRAVAVLRGLRAVPAGRDRPADLLPLLPRADHQRGVRPLRPGRADRRPPPRRAHRAAGRREPDPPGPARPGLVRRRRLRRAVPARRGAVAGARRGAGCARRRPDVLVAGDDAAARPDRGRGARRRRLDGGRRGRRRAGTSSTTCRCSPCTPARRPRGRVARGRLPALVRGGDAALDVGGARRRVRRDLRGLHGRGSTPRSARPRTARPAAAPPWCFTAAGPMAWAAASLLADIGRAGTDLWLRLNPVVDQRVGTKVVGGARGTTLVTFNDARPPLPPTPDHLPLGLPCRRPSSPAPAAGSAPRWPASSPPAATTSRSAPVVRTASSELRDRDHHRPPRPPRRRRGARRQRPRPGLRGVPRVPRRARRPRPGRRQRRPRQGPAARHRPLRRQPADRRDQLHRRARPDRGGRRDLPRPGRRPPGDGLVVLGAARDAGEHHDVRRDQGRASPTSPRGSAPTCTARRSR